jgi:hypothetical protein
MDKKKMGLYQKFIVRRTDGRDAPGCKHAKCRYFVLDLTHDPFAIPALYSYKTACAGKYPKLHDDLDAYLLARAKRQLMARKLRLTGQAQNAAISGRCHR